MAHPTTISASELPGSSLVLRNALILASVLDLPLRILDFRQGRNKPGIQPADSALVRLTDRVSGGRNAEARLGDEEVRWEGGSRWEWEGEWNASPGPTTSLPILFQAVFPALLFANSPSQLHFLAGSTDLPDAPPLDHTINVLLTFLQTHLGAPAISITLLQRGSLPLGRAQLSAQVQPLSEGQVLRPVTLLEQGDVVTIRGSIVITNKMPTHTLTRARDAIAEVLSLHHRAAEVPLDLTTAREAAAEGDRGEIYITIWAETSTGCRLGGSSSGERGRRTPEEVGREAAEALLRELDGGGCIDSWMQAFHPSPKRLSRTPSTLRLGPLTKRAQLAMDVATKLTGAKFEVEQEGEGCILRVWGISWYR
ncbi:RNA 3'-terminal phosphate cyclase domain-containing protein [Leucosporidium creatinivorum]|uniref:RNA 3'-terminal phosphate cyclase domain-containing protein n=1 Tax=Leucosporidium creatinivorum TaxID=106004 RepID=A0A1Y2ENP7_9BASI|nr:RNA 3'-terminal phosphate cyclase domain-containing protein [Leucosporidium creatinivorum]